MSFSWKRISILACALALGLAGCGGGGTTNPGGKDVKDSGTDPGTLPDLGPGEEEALAGEEGTILPDGTNPEPGEELPDVELPDQ